MPAVQGYAPADIATLAAEIQFQHAVDTVNAFVIPGVALPSKHLKQRLKTTT